MHKGGKIHRFLPWQYLFIRISYALLLVLIQKRYHSVSTTKDVDFPNTKNDAYTIDILLFLWQSICWHLANLYLKILVIYSIYYSVGINITVYINDDIRSGWWHMMGSIVRHLKKNSKMRHLIARNWRIGILINSYYIDIFVYVRLIRLCWIKVRQLTLN